MMKKSRPDVIICPECKAWRVNRRFQCCGYCGVGLKFKREFVYEGDWYYDNGEWVTYEQLKKKLTLDKSTLS